MDAGEGPASLAAWAERVQAAPARVLIAELVRRGVLPPDALVCPGDDAPVQARPDRDLHGLALHPARGAVAWNGVEYPVTRRMIDVLWVLLDAYPEAVTAEVLGARLLPGKDAEKRIKNARQQVAYLHRAVPGLVRSAYRSGRIFNGGYWLNLRPGDDARPAPRADDADPAD